MPTRKGYKRSRRVSTKKTKKSRKSSTKKGGRVSAGLGLLEKYGSYIHPGLGVIGKIARAALPMITGHGDYTVSGNSLAQQGGAALQAPSFTGHKGGFRMAHREYLKDITSTVLFANATNLYINPGNTACFPWLSAIAAQFEQWTPHGIVFEFRTTSVDSLSSQNTALGNVILATEYNTVAPPFISKAQAENTFFCTSGKPSANILHPIECAVETLPQPWLYVRPSNNTLATTGPNQDVRLSDLGLFQLMTSGNPLDDIIVGELWVSYDIEFQKPILPLTSTALSGPSMVAMYALGSVAQAVGVSNCFSASSPLGPLQGMMADNFPGGLSFCHSGNLPAGYNLPGDLPTLALSMFNNTLVIPAFGEADVFRVRYDSQGAAETAGTSPYPNVTPPNMYVYNSTLGYQLGGAFLNAPPATVPGWTALSTRVYGGAPGSATNINQAPNCYDWTLGTALDNYGYPGIFYQDDVQAPSCWSSSRLMIDRTSLTPPCYSPMYLSVDIVLRRCDPTQPMFVVIDYYDILSSGSLSFQGPGPTYSLNSYAGNVQSEGAQRGQLTVTRLPSGLIAPANPTPRIYGS